MSELNNTHRNLREIWTTVRIILFTIALCCVAYPLIMLIIGQTIIPWKANGWLVKNDQGEIIGSGIIAQSFTHPEYFWPRPSAVDFNAAGAGGSNLSPTNPELRKRTEKILNTYPRAKSRNPVPVDLVTASGSGLDPHITLRTAKYQVERVAEARGISPQVLERLLDNLSFKALNLSGMESLVNVLHVNLELDKMTKGKRSPLPEKRSNRQNEQ